MGNFDEQPRGTSASGISQWSQIFDDPVVAAAMLDRLMHRSVIVPIDGDSYRMRTHQHHTNDLRKGLSTLTQRD